MPPRGRTGVGRVSRTPRERYDPSPGMIGAPIGLTIHFQGEDGRQATFDLSRCACPGWHEALAVILAMRMSGAGPCRTLASARALWDSIRCFMKFLDQNTKATVPERLRAEDVRAFLAWRMATVTDATAVSQFRVIASLLRMSPVRERIPAAAMSELTRRRPTPPRPGKPAYSPHELKVMTRNVRRDVARIRDRLLDGEARVADPPGPVQGPEAMRQWKDLVAMASSGVVPDRVGAVTRLAERTAEARQLFLTWPDMTPMMALLVIVTGRNVETIKELPAEHRILDGRAVEVRLTKRRRGRHRWQETVTWEIGPTSRQLFTPGGLYLLVHQLCTRSRTFSNSETIWSLWRNRQLNEVASTVEHVNPFANGLHTHSHYLGKWRPDGVVDHRTGQPLVDARGELVRMDFQRLRTSVEVRRVRAMGGHLPSAARSNSAQTLFGSYLRNDPTAREWAQEIMGQALVDAQAVAQTGPGVLPRQTAEGGVEQTAWSACRDINNHPVTAAPCQSSFLDCFGCANCVVTHEHLPGIVALGDTLAQRRQYLAEADWRHQYGQAWTSIRHDVLPRFTPAEVAAARRNAPADVLLDLVEPGWEKP